MTEKIELKHLDDVPWHQAPIPRRFHRCWAQTTGWVNYFSLIERCACGAISYDRGRWIDKNIRRRGS